MASGERLNLNVPRTPTTPNDPFSSFLQGLAGELMNAYKGHEAQKNKLEQINLANQQKSPLNEAKVAEIKEKIKQAQSGHGFSGTGGITSGKMSEGDKAWLVERNKAYDAYTKIKNMYLNPDPFKHPQTARMVKNLSESDRAKLADRDFENNFPDEARYIFDKNFISKHHTLTNQPNPVPGPSSMATPASPRPETPAIVAPQFMAAMPPGPEPEQPQYAPPTPGIG